MLSPHCRKHSVWQPQHHDIGNPDYWQLQSHISVVQEKTSFTPEIILAEIHSHSNAENNMKPLLYCTLICRYTVGTSRGWGLTQISVSALVTFQLSATILQVRQQTLCHFALWFDSEGGKTDAQTRVCALHRFFFFFFIVCFSLSFVFVCMGTCHSRCECVCVCSRSES